MDRLDFDFFPNEVDKVPYNTLCENLHRFSLLRKLDISNFDADKDSLENFDDIVDKCQALKELQQDQIFTTLVERAC
jgi:hypothetical protein